MSRRYNIPATPGSPTGKPRGGGRRYRRSDAPAGVLAHFDVMCPICDELIQRHVSQVVQRKGAWVHVGCVNGADE